MFVSRIFIKPYTWCLTFQLYLVGTFIWSKNTKTVIVDLNMQFIMESKIQFFLCKYFVAWYGLGKFLCKMFQQSVKPVLFLPQTHGEKSRSLQSTAVVCCDASRQLAAPAALSLTATTPPRHPPPGYLPPPPAHIQVSSTTSMIL